MNNYFKVIASRTPIRTGTAEDCFMFDSASTPSIDSAYRKALAKAHVFTEMQAIPRIVVWRHQDTHRQCRVIGETEPGTIGEAAE